MNISKKLLLTALFGLSMQPIAQAYDVTELKTKVTHILDFIDTCKQSGPEAQKVAQWLEDKINSTSENYLTQDIEIITIERTIAANTTTDTKIDILSERMTRELAAQAQRDADRSKGKKMGVAIAAVAVYSYGALIIRPMMEFYNKRLTKQVLTKTPWSEIFKNKLFA